MHPIPLLVATLALIPTVASAAEHQTTSLLELQYDTNLMNSPNNNQPLLSPVVKASQELGSIWWASDNKRVKTDTEISAKIPTKYTDMITADGRVTLNGTWQPSWGFTKPWYNLALGSQVHWSTFDHHQWIAASAAVNRAQRLSDRLFWDTTLATEWRKGQEAAFDGLRSDLTLYQNYVLTPRVSLYSSQKLGYGQLVTSYAGALASKNHHLPAEQLTATADSISDLYFLDTDLTNMLGANWFTYGLPGYYGDVLLGANTRVTARLVVDLAYRFHIEGDETVQYSRHMLFATLIYPW